MGTQEEREKVRSAIRGLMEADRAADCLKPREHYKGLFAGHSDLVAEEYGKASAEESVPEGATVTSDRPGTPVPSMPSGPDLPLEIERLGPYRVLEELGRGGMGVVFLAEDSRIGRRVALKVLPAHFASSRHLQARFHREAALASKLDHPHICTVYEAGEADGVPYMAMRFLEGKPLSEWVGLSRESKRPSGVVTLPPIEEKPAEAASSSAVQRRDLDRLLLLFEKAARALHAAHEKGLIHRDIKPHNIMVTAEGEPVLLDFGLAREEEGEGQGLTQTGSLMGTPAYLSPEQLAAQRIKLDRRTDVYSLGVALYECLTLRLPFEAPTLDGLYQKILMTEPEDPRRLNRSIPKELRVVVETAIERDRERRYQTSLDLAEDLRRLREREPIRAKPPGLALRALRWTQRNPAIAASMAVITMALTLSLRQQAITERSLRRARVLALANASVAAVEEDPVQAVLLAREAFRAERCPEAATRLQEALRASRLRATLDMQGPDEAITLGAVFSPASNLVCSWGVDQWDEKKRRPQEYVLRVHDLGGRLVRRLAGHGAAVHSVRFSPAGDRMVSASADGTARIWSTEGAGVAVLKGHEGRVRDAAFSASGDMVATAGDDGNVRLWTTDGQARSALSGLRAPAESCAFSPDGSRVLAVGADGRACLWDIAGALLAVLGGEDHRVEMASFSPDGTMVLTAGKDGTARLFDLSGAEVRSWRGHGGAVTKALFSVDGNYILTVSSRLGRRSGDGTVRLWRATGEALLVVPGEEPVAFLGVGGEFLSGGEGNVLRIRSAEGREAAPVNGRRQQTLEARPGRIPGYGPPFMVSAFSGDGRWLFSSDGRNPPRLWSLRGDSWGQCRDAWHMDLARDGRTIVLEGVGLGGVTRVADLDGMERASFPGRPMDVAGERILVEAPESGELRMFDFDGRPIAVMSPRPSPGSRAGAGIPILQEAHLSSDGARVLVRFDLSGLLYGWQDGLIEEIRPSVGEFGGPRFSPAGTRIAASANPAGHTIVCDASGKEIHRRIGEWFRGFSPDGRWIVTHDGHSTASLWDLDGNRVAPLPHPHTFAPDPRLEFSFCERGDHLATATRQGAVLLWDTRGTLLATLTSEGPAAECMAVDCARGRVVAAFDDFSSRHFDFHGSETDSISFDARSLAPSSQGLGLAGMGRKYPNLVLTPDGRRVISLSRDGVLSVSCTSTADLLEDADRLAVRDFTPEEREKYADLLEPVPAAGK